MNGLAPDGGLYMPESIPVFGTLPLEDLKSMSYAELAYFLLNVLLKNEIDNEKLKEICLSAYDYEVPLEKVDGNNYIMRLDRGPTASFKDFAARVMGRLMEYYHAEGSRKITILTATSGDTGGAIANAFHGLRNIKAVILYPADEVTDFQRKQMTTLRDNISVIALNGKFDDCQYLVKKAFMDRCFSGMHLTSANSINIGRLLPQTVYYFWAWSRISESSAESVIFSVPSGNFGNLMGGLIAKKMGLPVERFIVATNENNEVPEYLKTGSYEVIKPSRNCISSAMNVGHPSNMARVIALYEGTMDEKGKILVAPDFKRLRSDLYAVSITDVLTRKTIGDFYRKYRLILEPHGAVAWAGMEEFLNSSPATASTNSPYIVLETAHPAKFRDEIFRVLGIMPEVPSELNEIYHRSEDYITLENNYESFRDYLLKNI